MKFWDNVKKFTQPYADDEYDDDEYDEDVAGEDYDAEPERPASAFTRPEDDTADGDDGFSFSAFSAPAASDSAAASTTGGYSSQVMGSRQQVVLVQPAGYGDAPKIARDLCSKKAAIVNMEDLDKATARRIVDFLSGCVFALDGAVTKVAQSTYLFSPRGMEVSGSILKNLQSEMDSYV